jgi:uncharacterized NAD(P)/FAD-binding protein YdhS
MNHRIAIVGGGPRSVYALERLGAVIAPLFHSGQLQEDIQIHVFDSSGCFGGGAVHSVTQAATNRLNVLAGQTTAFADESVEIADTGNYPPIIPFETLHRFLNRKGREIEEHEFPFRNEFGAYLSETFNRLLQALPENTSVHLRDAQVCDIEPVDSSYRLYSQETKKQLLTCDVFEHILLITGHCKNRRKRQDSNCASATRHILDPYPIDLSCSYENIPPKCRVAVRGKGLAFIDAVLALTVGRGGEFLRDACGKLRYRFSDESGEVQHVERKEPSKIFALSRTDILLYAKGINQRGNAQYRARFLTFEEIDRLRTERRDRKLHFEAQVLPLLILDMASEFYCVKYGQRFLKHFISAVYGSAGTFSPRFITKALVEELYQGSATSEATCFRNTIVPLAEREAHYVFLKAFFGQAISSAYAKCSSQDECEKLIATLIPAHDRPFDYHYLVEPLRHLPKDIPREDYSQLARRIVEHDLQEALRGNLSSPLKAATLVPSDLVDNLRYVLNYGGLLPESHRRYVEHFYPLYNRISIGPPPDNIEKLLALVDAGILELDIGPTPSISWRDEERCFVCESALVRNSTRHADVLIEARVPAFHAENEDSLLYRNLLKRGLVRRYRNMAIENQKVSVYTSAGIEVDRSFCVIGKRGTPNEQIKAMGPPVEGVRWFTNLAARYLVNSIAMQNASVWALAIAKACQRAEEYRERTVVNQ